jgi:hypothetical protein
VVSWPGVKKIWAADQDVDGQGKRESSGGLFVKKRTWT